MPSKSKSTPMVSRSSTGGMVCLGFSASTPAALDCDGEWLSLFGSVVAYLTSSSAFSCGDVQEVFSFLLLLPVRSNDCSCSELTVSKTVDLLCVVGVLSTEGVFERGAEMVSPTSSSEVSRGSESTARTDAEQADLDLEAAAGTSRCMHATEWLRNLPWIRQSDVTMSARHDELRRTERKEGRDSAASRRSSRRSGSVIVDVEKLTSSERKRCPDWSL
mmetsp:Transcript_10481/g.32269  ORF Transcript_10481/g.32269 Transcript_10481/m.32269 type:complete len:218 (-) Transcript_10481:568-1221(-)